MRQRGRRYSHRAAFPILRTRGSTWLGLPPAADAALAKTTARLTDRDGDLAVPTKTVQESLRALSALGVPRAKILVD